MQKINTMLDEMETQYESGSEGQTESAFSLEDEETEGGSCGVYSHEEYDDYARVEAVVDSGSADFVSSREMAPNVTVRPSAGSQRGQHFISASGKRMANEGEQHLQIMTEEGTAAQIPWQITGVRKPLMSVSKLCDRGNRVTFGRGGGVIHNVRTGQMTPFDRSGGVYTLGLWVKQSNSQGFPRRGP